MAKINTSEKATIPDKHYVGMTKRGDGLPLAFITPWGDDAAGKKRIATVDAWAGGYYKQNDRLESITIDNVPMHGFKLTSDIRTGKYSASDKWRIEDPRGFELEITSGNLAELLSLGTFDKGEILDQCVWGRDKGINILVSVESEVYKEAVAFTQITKSSASWKDAKLGSTITLQNGTKGTYLGRHHNLSRQSWYNITDAGNSIKSSKNLLHVIHVPTTKLTYPQGLKSELHFIASPKLSAIVPGVELTTAEAEIKIIEWIEDKTCHIERSGYDNDPVIVAANPIINWKLTLESDLEFDFKDIKPGYHQYGLFRLNDDRITVCNSTYGGNNVNLEFVVEDKLKDGIYTLHGNVVPARYSYGKGASNTEWKRDKEETSISDFIQQVKEKLTLKISIDTKAGHTISASIM